MTAVCTIHDLFPLFQAHRIAVRNERRRRRRPGVTALVTGTVRHA